MAAQAMFFSNAVTWLLLGIDNLVRMPPGSAVPWFVALVIAVTMFGNAAAMLVAARSWFMV